MPDFNTYLKAYRQYLPSLEPDRSDKMGVFFHMLTDEAVKYGYIGPGSDKQQFLRHFLDSILPLNDANIRSLFEHSPRIAEMGGGAGVPGIFLSIIFTNSRFFLIEANGRRAAFMKKACEALGLNNVEIINARVEQTNLKVDLCMFRAFLKPLVSLELALYLLPVHGKVLYWRAQPFAYSETDFVREDADRHIAGLGYSAGESFKLAPPEELGSRAVMLFEYTVDNRVKYPRTWIKISRDKFVQSVK